MADEEAVCLAAAMVVEEEVSEEGGAVVREAEGGRSGERAQGKHEVKGDSIRNCSTCMDLFGAYQSLQPVLCPVLFLEKTGNGEGAGTRAPTQGRRSASSQATCRWGRLTASLAAPCALRWRRCPSAPCGDKGSCVQVSMAVAAAWSDEDHDVDEVADGRTPGGQQL